MTNINQLELLFKIPPSGYSRSTASEHFIILIAINAEKWKYKKWKRKKNSEDFNIERKFLSIILTRVAIIAWVSRSELVCM